MIEKTTINKVGIPDQPNKSFKADKLGIQPHAKALTSFIEQCDTPITIGIQGEWGSGKTSLLNLIDRNLNGDGDRNENNNGKFLQIWVNAWEHSLLSKPEETLIKIVNQIINQMAQNLKPGDKSVTDDLKKKFKVLSKGALRVAAASIGGSEATDVVDELTGNDSNIIAELQQELIKLAKDINTNKSSYTKIVVYVDDLDRIDPPDAVAILELLKNIFNVEHCVFVLAIDYQVVVKGLEGKFGTRTSENEWEFRAFFDKIIQLPFMMPVGQYNVGEYVESLLEQIGFLEKDQDEKIPVQIEKMVKLSIGGNPRSLKRLVNSLSLIQIFSELKKRENNKDLRSEIDEEKNSNNQQLDETQKDMLMFAIMCIQIKYPDIYEVLIHQPNFKKWDDKVALRFTDRKEETEEFPNFEKDFEISCGIPWKNYKAYRRDGGKEYTQNDAREEFNEYWERVLFIICYINPRNRRRADEISELLSYIDEEVLKKIDSPQAIASIIEQTSVTSVTTTDDLQTETKKGARTYYDGIQGYIEYFKSTNKAYDKFKPHENLLIDIDSSIREKYKDQIDSKSIIPNYTKTGGLVFNWKKEKGGKFFQIRFDNTDTYLVNEFGDKTPDKTFLRVYLYKHIKDYQHEKILSLFPAQSYHTDWNYTFKIRDIKDWNTFIESGLMDDSIRAIDRGKKVNVQGDKATLKKHNIKDVAKILDKGEKW